MGGLGNQLFQFAAARRLAHVRESELVLDLGWFRHEGKQFAVRRAYELGNFALSARTTTISPRAVAAHERGKRPRFSPAQLEVIRQHENDFGVDERVLNASDDALLIGYWQSEAYFADVTTALRHELRFTRAVAAPYARFQQVIDDPAAVAVHFRRGDYVANPQTYAFHGVLGREYYRRALVHVEDRVPNPVFVAFSDDPDWVEREFVSDFDLKVVRGGDAFQELHLMSRCSHHVIANSSFSWWGAWLGEREESVVVAPLRWFADPRADPSAIVPSRWQRL
jgi:Glycosyl transferase family 11